MSSYPNVPLQRGNDWDRKVAQATNYLLNETTYLQLRIDQGPLSAGESVFDDVFPITFGLVRASCFATARTPATTTCSFTILIGGVSAGTVTFLPGQEEGLVTLTNVNLPAFTDFEITAPNPADAVLDDITIIIAFKR